VTVPTLGAGIRITPAAGEEKPRKKKKKKRLKMNS